MQANTLLIGILADLLTAAFALYVAMRVNQAVAIGVPIRRTLFFWYGMAVFLVLDGGYAVLVTMFDIPAPIPVIVLMLRRLAFVLGTAALVSTLFWMAGLRLNGFLLVYYAALITYIEAISLYQNPVAHVQMVWSIQFVYSRQTHALLDFTTGVAIFAPLLVSSALALRRYRAQADRERRFRLAVFALSVVTFCIGIIMGFWDNEWFWYGLFENRLAFSVAAGMLFALRPPWFVRKYWAVPRLTRLDQWPT